MPGPPPYANPASLDRAEPEWLAERRRRGFEAWSAASMPGRGDEDWKYVDLDFDLGDFARAPEQAGLLGADEYLDALDGAAARITMVDGALVSAESGEMTAGGVLDIQDDRIALLAGAAPPGADIFTAANQAFAPPGGAVVIPAGRAVSAPAVVDVQAVAGGAVSFPRLTVLAGPNSEGSVVVVYRSAPGAEALVCPAVEALAGRNAQLSVTVVQRLEDSARLVARHRYQAERDASVRIGEIGLGGRYARQRLDLVLAGQGSSARMGGIYFGDGGQVLDYRIHVTHRGPRTSSDIFLKGAVTGGARAVWTGLMRIENEAAGASAFETNRNLVLSDRAKVHSVPNLEILTDDLQCGHGSSSGPLDEDHLYYLMSRGIPKPRAERLLVRAFFDEILSDLAEPGLAAPSRRAVAAKYAGGASQNGNGAGLWNG